MNNVPGVEIIGQVRSQTVVKPTTMAELFEADKAVYMDTVTGTAQQVSYNPKDGVACLLFDEGRGHFAPERMSSIARNQRPSSRAADAPKRSAKHHPMLACLLPPALPTDGPVPDSSEVRTLRVGF